MNYLNPVDHYKCGFLPPNIPYRVDQGLMQQDVANDCRYGGSVERYITNQSVYIPPLYPLTDLSVNYGTPGPKDGCPCLRYVQPP